MSQPSAKEIAERIIKTEKEIAGIGGPINYEMLILARAYLELEKEIELGKSALRCGECGNVGMFHHGIVMADEIAKLKEHNQRLKNKILELKSELLNFTGDDI